jgi:two-component system cell cycle sensor histidine kinase/response regulator CckA
MLALVVDDDDAIRSFIQNILHSENFETLEAEDGLQALEIVRMLDGAVDLIVTDVHMPGGDGLAFARAVRDTYRFVPIVLVSGHERPDTDFEFVQKPFTWKMLARVIRRLLPRAA